MTTGRILPPLDPNAITRSQAFALRWLVERHGDGVFDKNGIALAAGQTAPVMRSTWNRLRDHGLVEFYNPAAKGYGRLRVTAAGQALREVDRRAFGR
jgi:hypothetical protein